MELTEEQLMRRRAADKKYNDVSKEKERLRHKKYSDEHKEERKPYREANKEKLKEYAKLYKQRKGKCDMCNMEIKQSSILRHIRTAH
jgi:hypothetical protein